MTKQPKTKYTELRVLLVAVDHLIPSTLNLRSRSEEQVAQVVASIQEFGWSNPILTRPDRVIIAGHARLQAARQLGTSEVPTITKGDLTEVQCRAPALADNQSLRGTPCRRIRGSAPAVSS
jgi:ParB-like chromosome segregation protein Spo0J